MTLFKIWAAALAGVAILPIVILLIRAGVSGWAILIILPAALGIIAERCVKAQDSGHAVKIGLRRTSQFRLHRSKQFALRA